MSTRELMVEEIEKKYGLDAPKVIGAILRVPRDKFVPQSEQDSAYVDAAIPIGYGQTISQPFTVALMVSLLDLEKRDIVLEIGTGSGYSAAVMSLLCEKVYTIERISGLADEAKERLKKLGYKNVFVKNASGEKGWIDHAPYDAVVITAEVEKKVPQELFNQLKDKGILVAPIDGEMIKYKKIGEKLKKKKYGQFKFVPFIEE